MSVYPWQIVKKIIKSQFILLVISFCLHDCPSFVFCVNIVMLSEIIVDAVFSVGKKNMIEEIRSHGAGIVVGWNRCRFYLCDNDVMFVPGVREGRLFRNTFKI